MSSLSRAHFWEDKVYIPEYWREILVNQELTEDADEKTKIVNVLELGVLGAGGLQDERIEHGPEDAEDGAVAEVWVPDLAERCQTLPT